MTILFLTEKNLIVHKQFLTEVFGNTKNFINENTKLYKG